MGSSLLNDLVMTFHGYTDYVCSGIVVPHSSTMVASGCYNSTISVWDTQCPTRTILTSKHHNHPIECVYLLRRTPFCSLQRATKCGRQTPAYIVANHQKTVTNISVASTGRRLVPGGLDGLVRIFETSGWNVVAGLRDSALVHKVLIIKFDPNVRDRYFDIASTAEGSA